MSFKEEVKNMSNKELINETNKNIMPIRWTSISPKYFGTNF